MFTFRSIFTNYFKGILIGFGTLIPGVSGGTTAIILNVYEDLLECVSYLFMDIKKSLIVLSPLFVGGITGILVLSPIMDIFCDTLPRFSKILFGLISLISIFLFAKNTLSKKFKKKHLLYILCGTVIAILISVCIYSNSIIISSNNKIVLLLLGIMLSVALILPAISFSYMLLFFGIFNSTLEAIYNYDFVFLLPLGIGIICGTYLFSRLLNNLIKKYSVETYSFVLGFVITSILDIVIK